MNKMHTRTLLILSIYLFSQKINAQEGGLKSDCFSYLEVYSNYWKKDNLGKNGFRELMANQILNKCDFVGEKWSNLSKLLGHSNFVLKKFGSIVYRYRLNYVSKDIKAIGTLILEIAINDKGLITQFSVTSVDG